MLTDTTAAERGIDFLKYCGVSMLLATLTTPGLVTFKFELKNDKNGESYKVMYGVKLIEILTFTSYKKITVLFFILLAFFVINVLYFFLATNELTWPYFNVVAELRHRKKQSGDR